MILLIFMACRDRTVGVDTKYYCNIFEQFRQIRFRELLSARLYAVPFSKWTINFEPAYRLLNKILSLFFESGQAVTVCNSILIIALVYILIWKHSPMVMLSVWLYITLGFYQTEMNVARNAIAILMCSCALAFVEEKRPAVYLIVVGAAGMIHRSVLAYAAAYWIVRNVRLTEKRIFGAVAVSAMIGWNAALPLRLLRRILPARYARYLVIGNSRAESILLGVFFTGLVLLIYQQMTREERERCMLENQMGLWMFTGTVVLFGLGISITAGARAAALFSPYLIIFIPQMLSVIRSRRRRQMIAFEVAVICGAQYILRMSVNNIGGTIPYQFFWGK